MLRARTVTMARAMRRGTAGAAATLGLAIGLCGPIAARDFGRLAEADLTINEGDRTLNLEVVPDYAVVRGRDGVLPGGFRKVRSQAGTGLTLVESQGAAPAGGTALVESLAADPSVEFVGPVFRIGDRMVGAGDTLAVRFKEGVSAERAAEIVAGLDLFETARRGSFVLYRVGSVSGFDTINAVAQLGSLAEVEIASVNWLSEYRLNNYTATYGGTSAAAANVAGVVALVRDLRPDLDADQIIHVIKQTAFNGPNSTDAVEGTEHEPSAGNWSDGAFVMRNSDLSVRVIFDGEEVTTDTKRQSASLGFGVVNARTAAEFALSIDANIAGQGLPGGYRGEAVPPNDDFDGIRECGEDGLLSVSVEADEEEGEVEYGTNIVVPSTTTSHKVLVAPNPPEGQSACSFEYSVNGGSYVAFGGLAPVVPLAPGWNPIAIRMRSKFNCGDEQEPACETIAKVGILRRSSDAPVSISDPLFPYQWHLGVPIPPSFQDALTSIADMDVLRAWNEFSFRNPAAARPIAIIDDGVATDIPFDELNVVDEFARSFDSAQPRSGTSHGTSAAAVIAGAANGYAGVGIVPGFPLVAIRLPFDDDGTEGLLGDWDLYSALVAAVDQGANVICISATPVLSQGPCFPPTQSRIFYSALSYAAVRYAHGHDAVLVAAAGNTRTDPALFDLFDVFGPMVPEDLEDVPTTFHDAFERIITVGASTSNLGIYSDEEPLSVAWYSNRGRRLSVVAPSSDAYPDYEPCADTVGHSLLSLGIITNDTNLFGMGGALAERLVEQTPFGVPVEIPGFGAVGIGNYEVLSALYDSDEDVFGTPNRGILFYNDAGTVEVLLDQVVQDAAGSIFGSVLVQVRADNGVITNRLRIPVESGRFRYRVSGSIGKRENHSGDFYIKAADVAGNEVVVRARERFAIVDEALRPGSGDGGTTATKVVRLVPVPDPDDNNGRPPSTTGWKVQSTVKFAGGGSDRTTGIFRRSDQAGEGSGENPGQKIDWALATFYSPNIDVREFDEKSKGDSTRIEYVGTAVVDSDYDYISAPSGVVAQVDYSPPTRLGRYSVVAEAGNYRVKTRGWHTSPNTNPSLAIADISAYTESIQFRTPAFSTNLKNPIPPGFLGTFAPPSP